MSDVPEKLLRLPPTSFYRFSRESKRLPDLPDDTLPEILSRLPAMSLLRFRSVCKSWKVLIESTGFINDQLIHSRLKPNSSLKYIITKTDDFKHQGSDSVLNQSRKSNKRGFLYSEDDDSPTKRLWVFFSKLPHPFESHKTEILGSCNGLLVLSKGDDDIILWNPSTRRFKIITAPGIEFPLRLYSFIVFGFGYDSVSDDYKLVRIVQSCGPTSPVPPTSEVRVYSSKRNCWKKIGEFPYYLRVRRGNGEFVNGALHWIVGKTRAMNSRHDKVDCLVAAFDLQTEEYRLVPLPKFSSDPGFRIMNLGALGGCLTIVSNGYHARHHATIWVMKEYGVEESWFPLFILSRSLDGGVCFWDSDDVVMPIAYSDCGRKVLVGLGRGVLMWYDLDRKSFDQPVVEKICGIKNEEHFEVHTCLESLVLLNDSICDCDFDIITKKEQEKGEYLSRTLRMHFLDSWFSYDDGIVDLLEFDAEVYEAAVLEMHDNDLLEYIGN